MSTLLLLLAATCPETKMLNTSKEPWNDYDMSIYKYATKRCKELYSDAECVKLFKKYNVQQYSVVCGNANTNEPIPSNNRGNSQ